MKVSPKHIFGFVAMAGQLAKLPPKSIEVTECPQRNPEQVKIALEVTPQALAVIWSELPEQFKPVILTKLPFIKDLLPAEDAAAVEDLAKK